MAHYNAEAWEGKYETEREKNGSNVKYFCYVKCDKHMTHGMCIICSFVLRHNILH